MILRILPICLFIVSLVSACTSVSSPNTLEKRVEDRWSAWMQGTGNPFELLSKDVEWTIIGSTPSAGTYRLDTFLKEVVAPFSDKLSEPLRPTEWKTYSKGNIVVIHFKAEAPLKNGLLYQNEYVWFFNFRDGKVYRVRAFLDLAAYEQVILKD